MSLDTTNLVFSLVILQQRKIERAKALAASVGAALIPGPIGLVVPAIVASRTPEPPPGGTLPPPTDTGVVKVKVPGVVGQLEENAVRLVRDADLTPVTSVTFSASEKEVGQVVDQDPAEDEYAPTRSEVELTIAHAQPRRSRPTSEELDDIRRSFIRSRTTWASGSPSRASRSASGSGSSGSGSTS